MKFEEFLDIKPQYDSNKVDVYSDFFNKILPHCHFYQRFGGIFSGGKFVQFAYGLQEFIHKNSGIMQLAVIPDFEESDLDAFREKTISTAVSEKWINDLSKIEDELSKNHVKALAWMIGEKKLEIKLILPMKDDGTSYSRKELEETDLLEEVGIFFNKDDATDVLSFRGKTSTKKGIHTWIHTSRPWEDSESEKIDSDVRDFDNLWENENGIIRGVKCKVLPLSDKLLDFFKEESKDVEIENLSLISPPSPPRDYQELAVNDWAENGHKGIFEMATGTGKTIAAIECVKKIHEKEENLFVVVTAPYRHLVDQWQDEFRKYNIIADRLENNWQTVLGNKVRSASSRKLSVVICTHAKFNSDKFVSGINRCKIPTMVIVDEAHHLGAGTTVVDDDAKEDKKESYENPRNGLIKKYQYRIALSATIDRYFDDFGTDFLEKYFAGTKKSRIIKYGMKEAMDAGWLCEYNYHPYSVKLTDKEFLEYKEYTRVAISLLNQSDPAMQAAGRRIIMIKRAKTIRDAENKKEAFIKIMKKIGIPKYLLIFASENQFSYIIEILQNAEKYLGIYNPSFAQITAYIPSNKKERLVRLRDFKNGDIQILLSNKVLDEGLNIPEANSCIVLASTGNPTQFIQRRGRILRPFDGLYKDGSKKTHAEIYDILVKPEIDQFENIDEKKTEKKMIARQLKKLEEMSDLARNRDTDEYNDFIKEFIHPFTMGYFENEY